MARAGEKLIVKMAKHPLVWMGAGIWIRNYDYNSERAEFWKGVGTVAILAGLAHAVDEHSRGKSQAPSLVGVVRQIFTPHSSIPVELAQGEKEAVV
jgi:hypothetical protein